MAIRVGKSDVRGSKGGVERRREHSSQLGLDASNVVLDVGGTVTATRSQTGEGENKGRQDRIKTREQNEKQDQDRTREQNRNEIVNDSDRTTQHATVLRPTETGRHSQDGGGSHTKSIRSLVRVLG